jgi:hypothetical protein
VLCQILQAWQPGSDVRRRSNRLGREVYDLGQKYGMLVRRFYASRGIPLFFRDRGGSGRGIHPKRPQRRLKLSLRCRSTRAFMTIYKGFTLPGPAALEKFMREVGVSSKQTGKARQAFMRSARPAGFFAHGEDRLVRPADPGTKPISAESNGVKQDVKPKEGGGAVLPIPSFKP